MSAAPALVACRVRHYWAGDDAWYEGRVVDVDSARGVATLRYDDGEYHEVDVGAASDEFLMFGSAVHLAKVSGHGAWPAQEFSTSPALDRAELIAIARPANKKFVLFFGTDEQAAVAKSNLAPYETGLKPSSVNKQLSRNAKKADALCEALALADAEVAAFAEQIALWERGAAIPRGAIVEHVAPPGSNTRTAAEEAFAVAVAEEAVVAAAPPPPPEEDDDAMDFDEDEPVVRAVVRRSSGKRVRKPDPRRQPKVAAERPAVAAARPAAKAKKAALAERNRCAGCRSGPACNTMTNSARCSQCARCFHLDCWGGPPMVKAPAALSRGAKQWLCADCSQCQSCGMTQRAAGPHTKAISKVRIERLKGGPAYYSLCKDCSDVFRRGKFCPQCEKGTREDEEDLVDCDKCKSKSHVECEEAGAGHGDEFWCVICRGKVPARLLHKLRAIDAMLLFAEPVNADNLPNYAALVPAPMDLFTMAVRADAGDYRMTQPLRSDVELMCANAVTFNRAGDKIWAEAVRFFDAATELFVEFDREGKSCPSSHAARIAVARAEHSDRKEKEKAYTKRAAAVRKDMFAGRAVAKALDIKRTLCGDAASCVHVHEMALPTRRAAVETAWHDLCMVCGSSEALVPTDFGELDAPADGDATALVSASRRSRLGIGGGEMLFCVDCGEAMHAFCASAPNAQMSAEAKATWRCPNCKVCELCGLCKPDDEVRLLYCDVCDKGYHLECVVPPLASAPTGRWVCELCIDCRSCDAPRRRGRWSSRADACSDCAGAALRGATQLAPLGGRCAALGSCAFPGGTAAAGALAPPVASLCSGCGARFHHRCFSMCASATGRCARCADDVLPGGGLRTHLGNTEAGWRVAVAVARVARARFRASRRGAAAVPTAAAALKGWDDFYQRHRDDGTYAATRDALGSWQDGRHCALCKKRGDCADAGRLLPVEEHSATWVHANCAVWSSEVYEVDRNLINVRQAISRSKTLRCTHCGLGGATMGCCGTNCNRNYHFRCGAYDGAVHVDRAVLRPGDHARDADSKVVYCAECFLHGHGGGTLYSRSATKKKIKKEAPLAIAGAEAASEAAAKKEDDDGDDDLDRMLIDGDDEEALDASDEAPLSVTPKDDDDDDELLPDTAPEAMDATASQGAAAAMVEAAPAAPPAPVAAPVAAAPPVAVPIFVAPPVVVAAPVVVAPPIAAAPPAPPAPPAPAPRPETPPPPAFFAAPGLLFPLAAAPGGFIAPPALPPAQLQPAVAEAKPACSDEQTKRVKHEAKAARAALPPSPRALAVPKSPQNIAKEAPAPAPAPAPTFNFFQQPMPNMPPAAVAPPYGAPPYGAAAYGAAAPDGAAVPYPQPLPLTANGNCAATVQPAPLPGASVAPLGPPSRKRPADKAPLVARGVTTAFGDVLAAIRIADALDGKRTGHDAYDFFVRARDIRHGGAPAAKAVGGPRPAKAAPAATRTRRPQTHKAGDDDVPLRKGKSDKKKHSSSKVAPTPLISPEHAAWLDDRVERSRGLGARFRLGALVVHDIGRVAPVGYVGFQNATRIFPLGYRATRIFWSATAPMARAVYACEVVAQRRAAPPGGGAQARETYAAVFRVTQLDAPGKPREGSTPVDVVRQLRADVAAVNAAGAWRDRGQGGWHSSRRHLHSYGLGDDGCGFFGFSAAAVRAKVEGLPSAATTALGDGAAYQFCYVVPSEADVLAAQRAAASRDAQVRPSPSGSARSEPRDTASAAATNEDRITRSLVRSAREGEGIAAADTAAAARRTAANGAFSGSYDTSIDENRDKYRAMKAVPMLDRLDVRRSHIHGWGLYLTRDVRRHDFIIEYVGEVVRQCVGDKREKYYDDNLGVGSCYLFRLDGDHIVDATRRGSAARFINHCCRPNAYARVLTLDTNVKKIIIVA
ncbi:hypothetical protein M885DRAFT_512831 [Pelagophyceae sp. CCMP2097]|nr:hypothetical protein M885DRAFT_512831 [Pelagophyceae sp. CCMP2097]